MTVNYPDILTLEKEGFFNFFDGQILNSAFGIWQRRGRGIKIYVEGVTLVLPSRLFMFNEYWRILALS